MKNKNLLIGAGVVVVGYLLWKKSQNNSVANSVTKSDIIIPENALVRPYLGQPQKIGDDLANGINLATPLNPDFELRLKVGRLPDEFIIKSNGFSTKYYQVRGSWSTSLFKQSFKTDGSIGGVQPQKISNSEFLKAYDEFLKQPK